MTAKTSASSARSKTATLVLPRLYHYQKALLNDRSRDVAVVSATQVGKTFAIANWILACAWRDGWRPLHPSWWVAPTYNQVEQGFRLVTTLARSAGILKGRPVMSPYPRVTLVNSARIEFRSWEREDNLFGTTIARAAVDEAGLLTPEAQAAISSRRSGTMGPVRYIGNPGHTGGPFRRLCSLGEQGMAGDPDWSGIMSLHRWTWRDKHAALFAVSPVQAAAYKTFIEQERASLPEYEFRRLYEAEWTEDEAAVFRNVQACVDDNSDSAPMSDDFVIGVDVAQVVDFLVAVSMGRTSRRLEVRYRTRGISYAQAAIRLRDLQKEFRAPLVVEDNGPGVALIQELKRLDAHVVPFTTTAQSKQEAILTLAADVQQQRVTIADHPPMVHEFEVFRYERMPSGLYRYAAPAGEHDDCVMAAALARHGIGRSVDLDGYGWLH